MKLREVAQKRRMHREQYQYHLEVQWTSAVVEWGHQDSRLVELVELL